MLFAVIHELGHLLAGLLLGMKPEKLEIMPYGISISFKMNPQDYNNKIKNGNKLELKKIIVALAGPLTNVIMIIIIAKMNLNIFASLTIIYANCLIAIFNLLPIYPLDGGRILKGILHISLGKKKALKYANNIAIITTAIITIISSIAILYLKNIAIFIIVIFLWSLVLIEDKKFRTKQKIYEQI